MSDPDVPSKRYYAGGQECEWCRRAVSAAANYCQWCGAELDGPTLEDGDEE